MKTIKRALAYVLLLAMLLSSLGGYALGASDGSVSLDRQLVFEPLAEAQSVAYERHADGYEVTLDRDADGVTMNVAAVPAATAAEQASLYIRTGVVPEAGKTYRISYTLASEQALEAYTVCFDGAQENAYGAAETRSVAAGVADLARFLLTPAAESGELVLRLQLGKTPVNTLRFSGLTVEEATEEEIAAGANTVLVDKLNLNAPGSIALWTNDDCGAQLTAEGESATLTVTDVPRSGAEVWKIKLLTHTGVRPEAGKTYRFRANVSSTANRIIEICYNEGETEKGYAVLYNQPLNRGTQTMSRLIYVPAEKTDAGELVFQLSLGKLQKGDQVTISDISVEEAVPTYKNVLDPDFAFDTTREDTVYDPESLVVSGTTEIASTLNAGETKIWKSGDRAGALSFAGSEATLRISGNTDDEDGVWEAALHIETPQQLSAGKTYLVTFDVCSAVAYTNFEALYSYGGASGDGTDRKYGGIYGRALAANTTEAVSKQFTVGADDAGALVVLLQLGATGGQDNTLTVSNLRIDEVTGVTPGSDVTPAVTYPTAGVAGSFEPRDACAYIVGDDHSATISIKDGFADWQRALFVNGICDLAADTTYQVSFKIKSATSTGYTVQYCEGTAILDDGAYGSEAGTAGSEEAAVVHTITPTAETAGSLTLRIDLPAAGLGTQVKVSDFAVKEVTDAPSGTNIATVTYPDGSLGQFSARDDLGVVLGDGSSASMLCTDAGSDWQRALFGGDICSLEADKEYVVSFDVVTDGNEFAFDACYNKDSDWVAGEKGYGAEYGKTANATAQTYQHTINTAELGEGTLRLRFDFGNASVGTRVTISSIAVRNVTDASDVEINLDYPTMSGLGNIVPRDNFGVIVGDGDSATVTVPDAVVDWKRALFVNSFCDLEEGKSYQVSFGIEADNNTAYTVQYCNGDAKWNAGAYGSETGTANGTTATVKHTIPALASKGVLTLRIDFPAAASGTRLTVSDVKVEEITGAAGGDNLATVTYPAGSWGSFVPRDECGILTGDASSATVIVGAGFADWQKALFIKEFCGLSAGKAYQISFDIEANSNTAYSVQYCEGTAILDDGAYGSETGTATATAATVTHTTPNLEADGVLTLRIDFPAATPGTVLTVSNLQVKECDLITTPVKAFTGFRDAWKDEVSPYTTTLTQLDDCVRYYVDTNGSATRENYFAKLVIRTGVIYEAGKNYRVKFDIESTKAQSEFVVITEGVSDSADIRGTWSQSLAAGEKKTITTRPIPAGFGTGDLNVRIELGKLNAGVDTNTYTVSNVRVEEVAGSLSEKTSKLTGTVDNDMQDGYTVPLTRAADSATVSIEKTPDTGMEAWKSKLFIHTGVPVKEGETYRVRMDVLAENDMDYEVCYNCGGLEKGFDAIYGLYAKGDRTQTVERLFTAERSGDLTLQLSLGNVPAPNAVTVSNVTVEKATYVSGGDALPEPLAFRGSSAVSYWAHADYTTELTGTDDAITMHVLKAPGFGAEPWKIKLFLDTETPLQAGKFYRVTTELLAKSPQNVEICYNSGGAEMGYDAMGGIRLAAGEKQTVEKLIAVPADKTDGKNLMLQVNLGAATSPNEITVSGVTVEEVSLRYADLMPQGFSYQKHSTVRTSPDIDAKLEATTGTATICITDAPATGAEVWMAQLLVRTGVVLAAGKSYVVRANLVSDKDLTYELCFNNEETEKGFDVLYGQFAHANATETIDKKISVPASMTDAGELVLQFSVGGPGTNNVTVANVSVQEIRYGAGGAKNLAPAAAIAQQGTLSLDVSREAVTGHVNGRDGVIRVTGAALCAGEQYEAAFTGKADAALTGTLTLRKVGAAEPAMAQRFELSPEAKPFAFTTEQPLDAGGAYELLWQFQGSGTAELSDITLSIPAEELIVKHVDQKVTVNGAEATPDVYEINGENYFKLRDLAMLLNDTLAQFVVRYNSQSQTVSVTTGKPYSPVGGELERGADRSASCMRGTRSLLVDGKAVSLKAYNLGSNNYFRLADLDDILGFRADYIEASDTVAITSPLTPEAQEASYAYGTFFRPEIDSESQPYVGDPMAFYENGTYYIYYLKEGGDSINHSVYLTTTTDFSRYTEYDKPVLAASRGDAQDSWIGTGSVTKVGDTYYFFYTGYNSSGVQEYHEKIMVAKSDSPTSFEKVSGWEITPPASLGQKNDFRDPQAYYDPKTGTISLTVTASQGGVARILKYTLDKDLQNVSYDGIIYTDPSGKYWNLECSDTFRLGDKWYLTYSGQEDTLWYATADSQFGPYSEPVQLDGKVFYAAKHVEGLSNAYMVGWARRSESASSTQEVAGWGGNLMVQKLAQRADGSLALVPLDSVVSSFRKPKALDAESVTLTADADYSFRQICTGEESFMLTGEFTCTGTGSFGLAFDFNGKEEAYKLISVNPKENTLSLAFNEGVTKIAETPAELGTKHSFTYIQDGSVGIFYVDQIASLAVRIYGSTGKPVYLFAQDNSVSFTSLQCFTK